MTKLDGNKQNEQKEDGLGTNKEPGKVKSHATTPVDESRVGTIGILRMSCTKKEEVSG